MFLSLGLLKISLRMMLRLMSKTRCWYFGG